MADPLSNEIRVNLPGASAPVTLPTGWSRESAPSDTVTILSPEGDLRVAFAIVPLEGTPEEMAGRAWRAFDRSFDFPVLQKMPMPGAGGWDAIFQVIYNVPEAQSRVAVAVLRTLQDKAYCGLISGAKGGLSRRYAQVMEALQNWKPEGLVEPSLAGSKQHKWEENQSADMSEFLRHGMAELQIPGAAIAVVQGGRIVFAEGFGVTKIGSSEAVRPDRQRMVGLSFWMRARPFIGLRGSSEAATSVVHCAALDMLPRLAGASTRTSASPRSFTGLPKRKPSSAPAV